MWFLQKQLVYIVSASSASVSWNALGVAGFVIPASSGIIDAINIDAIDAISSNTLGGVVVVAAVAAVIKQLIGSIRPLVVVSNGSNVATTKAIRFLCLLSGSELSRTYDISTYRKFQATIDPTDCTLLHLDDNCNRHLFDSLQT
jgi:hypothetical protein